MSVRSSEGFAGFLQRKTRRLRYRGCSSEVKAGKKESSREKKWMVIPSEKSRNEKKSRGPGRPRKEFREKKKRTRGNGSRLKRKWANENL